MSGFLEALRGVLGDGFGADVQRKGVRPDYGLSTTTGISRQQRSPFDRSFTAERPATTDDLQSALAEIIMSGMPTPATSRSAGPSSAAMKRRRALDSVPLVSTRQSGGLPVYPAELTGIEKGALRTGRKHGVEVNNQLWTVTGVPETEYQKANANANYAPRERPVAYLEAASEQMAYRTLERLRQMMKDRSLQFSRNEDILSSPLDQVVDVTASVVGPKRIGSGSNR